MSQIQASQHSPPGQTILSMVPLPRVIEACEVICAKTDESICKIRNVFLEETGKCIAAVKNLDTEVSKRNDIEILKADVAAVSEKLNSVSEGFCPGRISPPSQYVATLQKSLESFKTEVLSVLASVSPSFQPAIVGNVDGESEELGSSSGKVLFVTVKHDGLDQNLYLTRCSRDTLLGCRKKREAIRRVLLHFSSIKELRQFSLTGESSSSYGKGQLPPLHAKFAEATVLKLFPPNPKLKEIINDDGSTKYDDDIKALRSEVRTKITSILEYYFKSYDADGAKIPEKKNPKRNNPHDDDFVENLNV
ncbi:unnamed protein product [Allacma fusca]|uniref:Uncharacterized protein n=1 Tax=Allacma fusca TaxID=39272 RepID=A0A8J2K862_9HEXA|nr:unnamed protein product [Allacma fusca]